jgi:hypothetical protein
MGLLSLDQSTQGSREARQAWAEFRNHFALMTNQIRTRSEIPNAMPLNARCRVKRRSTAVRANT